MTYYVYFLEVCVSACVSTLTLTTLFGEFLDLVGLIVVATVAVVLFFRSTDFGSRSSSTSVESTGFRLDAGGVNKPSGYNKPVAGDASVLLLTDKICSCS